MKLLITGANGFVGKNLTAHIDEMEGIEYVKFTKDHKVSELNELLKGVDCVIHLAGVNRPENKSEFFEGNTDLTKELLKTLSEQPKPLPVIYSSSIQAERDNAYGKSKRQAEELVKSYAEDNATPAKVYRLANVFGKWCKPNYNSMVATFCHNIARDLPIQVNDADAKVKLVYIDDVVKEFIGAACDLVSGKNKNEQNEKLSEVLPVYEQTVGSIAEQLRLFKNSRDTLVTEKVGDGFTRKLYSTYVSYLPKDRFSYEVPKHGDERGVFVEMLKTKDSGQFSFFTAHPGVTRGGHYHHTKNEKFLVIKGKAHFGFRHMVTNEYHELFTSGDKPEIVETAPGWSHDITNVGEHEMVVMLWANEIFDRDNPDTYYAPVKLS
ncbi:UDP-2-acetamido-2,6-beta-L-arabino-hexul-4-ose reductase [Idiomarina sp. UBA4520]|uniref:UDP-2-acetamido-2,6-beta-L-arabino-hexul-4-ose reductase n=1 Tax=Idiomarina sp. UBA4520 TaxID=1946647 RepID=UPI000C364CBC|nr:NAD-dependent epimerase/dehydratase family protein [Idiomarina sp. UBA4520]MBF39160.1 capsular biosynthesis protein [Idiomarinaceae bacterium]|tara:strand:- start:18366 stop:19502 length:1137 start_codon:yes stop_codon:yes gene_type:complete